MTPAIAPAGEGPPAGASARPRPAPGSGRRSRWLGGIACVCALLLVASVAGWLPARIMRVGSQSMDPTIPTGALVLVERWSTTVSRGDVVVVDPPDGSGPPLVKRAVAVGGDVVAIEDGVLVVDGARVCEPSIDPALIDAEYIGPLTVPPGELFLLGDNRAASIDSRTFGTVSLDTVQGRVVARLWPSPGGVGTGSC